jgi:S1-C subfamily serine protease
MRRSILTVLSLALAVPLAAQQVRVFSSESRQAAGDRAMLGVSTTSGSKRDTLGVLIASLTSGGPAEKAGLTEGDRIQSINGVSLKVSRDDAGDMELSGLMQRRLTRELGKLKAGDEVALQVWHDGASKTYKVKTVAADDLNPPKRAEAKVDDRAAIGISFGLTGSKRDTAGVFVNSVTEDGPAEKAGIVEGDRISAINGVSLKLSKDDLEDSWVAGARLNRLSREVAKAKPGDVVELTVVSGGRARAVKVTTVKATSLKGHDGGMTFFRTPEGGTFNFSMPTPPMPPMPPVAPRAPMIRYRTYDGNSEEVRVEVEKARQEFERVMKEEMPKVRIETQKALEEARKQLQEARVNMNIVRTVRM